MYKDLPAKPTWKYFHQKVVHELWTSSVTATVVTTKSGPVREEGLFLRYVLKFTFLYPIVDSS